MVQCIHITLGRISQICFIWYVMRSITTPAFANATVDAASVYTTGALFSCMSWEQHYIGFSFLSEDLSIIRFFAKSPLSLVVPRPLYSLIGFGLGLIFVIAFALLRWCITLQFSIVF